MFMQPTIEKLYTMKLTGMADALRQQISDSATTQLSFEERFSLLVDQHWTWRENKALASCAAMLAWRTSTGITHAAWIVPWCAAWPPPIGSASTTIS